MARTSSDVITVGNDGTVKAVGNGTAIVLVTYDSMTLNYHDDVKYSYDNYDPNGFYGAIWPENTGVFVVSVGSGRQWNHHRYDTEQRSESGQEQQTGRRCTGCGTGSDLLYRKDRYLYLYTGDRRCQ